MTKDPTTINKLVVTRGLRGWIRVHLEWNRGIIHSRNTRSCLKIKEKNLDYGEARGQTRIQTKVMVVEPPRNKIMTLEYQHWKHRIRTLTTR